MASSLASCITAVAHAPRSAQKIRNSRASRPNKDGDGVDTTKSSRSRFGRLGYRGKLHNIHNASDAADDLERTSRNAGPRPVHFPDTHASSASAGYDAPWISHRADEVQISLKKNAATTTTSLLEKQVSFQPRKSHRISPKNAIVADNSTWVELLVVSRKKGSNKSRSLFYNLETRHAYWDEPPSGASEVVYLGDLERLNALMARVERNQQLYRESCPSVVAAAAAKVDANGLSIDGSDHSSSVGSIGVDSATSASTQTMSLASASTVSWLSSHVGFFDAATTTTNNNNNNNTTTTIVQTRIMLLLFVINVSLVALLFSIGGVAISVSHGGIIFRRNAEYFIHAVLFQGALLVMHLWPSSK